ncbi:hypothetical protein DXG03_009153 [Asterophora parasitica]|uniref:DUF7719 domain-containing protein n=1 Tax=Asterophora parasitica TaxID=117018 RepID=A0A9P7G5Q6_9AGAR|nr:hypothetical protein DXG03_009153 [Asterophora parasitica]
MARNRKAKTSKSVPSEDPPDATEIPEDEQWRLVNESGILNKMTIPRAGDKETKPELPEEILDALIIIIPICFVLLLMEILIHFQYGKHPTWEALVERMTSGAPLISIFVFYTTRYKAHRRTQLLLFILGTLSGSRLLYLLDRGSWTVNMRQCPPLATAWVYAVVRLDLLPAVLNLGAVGTYVWWEALSLRL